ncbi:MAG: sodium-translocating pyrophosphatase, partial [Rhodothermaceae bacterium]|nr:sodium-translocating pyrophosphatase [Rhodothermaceae bacterium]
MQVGLLISLVCACGFVALFFAWTKARWITRQSPGTEQMIEIAGYIARGAQAFLRREYRVLSIFVFSVAVILAVTGLMGGADSGRSPLIAVSFLVGAVCSGAAGFVGMRVATKANVRTTNAARTGLSEALNIAFSGGLVMGLCVVGLGILGLSGVFVAYSGLTAWTPFKVLAV